MNRIRVWIATAAIAAAIGAAASSPQTASTASSANPAMVGQECPTSYDPANADGAANADSRVEAYLHGGEDAAAPTSASPYAHLMQLPAYERAVLIIKHFESLHRPEHWPTIGYGHVVQPGEPYKRGVRLTEAEADALLRSDLRKHCAMFGKFGRHQLLLGCLSYNCGPARLLGDGKSLPKSRLIQKLERGDTAIFRDYLSFCHYRGCRQPGLLRRRYIEFQLLFVP